MRTLQEDITRQVKIYMSLNDLSQSKLGDLIGLSQTAVSSRLKGRVKWSLRDIEALNEYISIWHPALDGAFAE